MDSAITKGVRHSAVVGRFGEHLICNWLSRSGFEVCVADQAGLDIIAAKYGRRLGITVKSRTRTRRESESVNLFSRRNGDRSKLRDACRAFGCEPWLGVYVECSKSADLYLTSLARYDKRYKSIKARAIEAWSMSRKRRNDYKSDPDVFHVHFDLDHAKWPPVN